ncbi:hypothetical protein PCANC_15486, partial [Puccinia coronata f. sp. avenae]
VPITTNHEEWTDENSGVQIAKGNPYLILLMSLKTEDDVAFLPAASKDDVRRASQVFHGLKSFACLREDLVEALQEMLDVEPHLSLLHDGDDGKEIAGIINPLAYPYPPR